MKRLFLLLFVISYLSSSSYTQVPNWLWAKSAGGINMDEARCVTTDKNGNVYVTGSFYSSEITFGSIALENSYYNWQDFFLVKYDSNGNVIWVKSAGGNGEDEANSVAVDASGNIYVTGYFNSDTLRIGNIKLVKIGGINFFLAKYDSNGNVLWAKSAGGASYNGVSSVTADESGNVYVVGYSQSWSTLSGSGELANNTGMFLTKYDPNGNIIWTKSPDGNGGAVASSVVVDASGNVYISGWYLSANLSFGSIVLVNQGLSDMFLAKYDSSGNVLWAKSLGSNGEEEAHSIANDASGNIYLAGSFTSDSITFGDVMHINAGAGGWVVRKDIFLAKYNSDGNELWARSSGGKNRDEANSVAVDASGNIYLTGSFTSDSITFGDVTIIGPDDLTKDDIFIVNYDVNGNKIWATSTSGLPNNREDVAYSVILDLSDNIYVTGRFSSYNLPFGNTILSTLGTSDIFLAKIGGINGASELNTLFSVGVYPNPCDDFINIKRVYADKKVFVEVINSFGGVVGSYKMNSGEKIISISTKHLISGLYFLRINGETKARIIKR
ncbi:MAG: SBBP repeat-containing protein [Bacteroidales bacterium]|nr:SBBP repeat-containing protein [Bacteroidales bacterium]